MQHIHQKSFFMEIAMEEPQLRPDCICFCQLLFAELHNSTVFGLTLPSAVALFLPYVAKFLAEMTNILHRFTVENRPAAQDSFAEISFISLFAAQSDLAAVNKVLSQGQFMPEFAELLDYLSESINTPDPRFRTFLLKQILRTFQRNVRNGRAIGAGFASRILLT
jgi:hypothetical protein